MNYVIQEDEYGCGVACVANILGKTYKETLPLFESPQNASWRGYFCKDLVYALASAQKNYKYFYVKTYKRNHIYKDETIVFIKRSKMHPAGHYLLRKGAVWVDPWINFPKYPRMAGERKRLPGIPIYAIQLMY